MKGRAGLDGRVVIAGLIGIGLVFVVLNLLFGGGQKGVRELARPESSPADRNVLYPVQLLSRCSPTVDFDGSYWGPPGGWTLAEPAEPAEVELTSQDVAVLHTKAGQRIRLERLGSSIRLGPCHASPTP